MNERKRKWQELLEELSTSRGPFFFLREGKTRVRLVPGKKDPEDFFVATTTTWQNQIRDRFLIQGLIASAPNREIPKEELNHVRLIVLPKTAFQGILQLLAEDYELLDPEKGHGLTLVRTGSGIDTSYTVMPSPRAVPLPDNLIWYEGTLAEASINFSERRITRGKTETEETEDDSSSW